MTGSKVGHEDEAVSRQPSLGPAELLRQHGVKVTAQRLAVLRAVSSRPHLTADDVDEAVSAEIGTISRRAVYDAVGILVDKGLLRRIQPAGSPARYEDRVGDNHHHLVCRTCGRMVDVDCAVGAVPCLTAADDAGYEIDEAEVIYWGRCPACQEAAEGGRRLRTTHGPSINHQSTSTTEERHEQRRARHRHHQRRAVDSDVPGDERRAPSGRHHGQPALVARAA